MFQINKLIKSKGNINCKTDLKFDVNSTNNRNDIKNVVSLVELKNKNLKRKIIPDLKNLNGYKKNLNNSYYKNTKANSKHNYSGLTQSNYNSNNKNKQTTQKLQSENNFISKVNNNIQYIPNQKRIFKILFLI